MPHFMRHNPLDPVYYLFHSTVSRRNTADKYCCKLLCMILPVGGAVANSLGCVYLCVRAHVCVGVHHPSCYEADGCDQHTISLMLLNSTF